MSNLASLNVISIKTHLRYEICGATFWPNFLLLSVQPCWTLTLPAKMWNNEFGTTSIQNCTQRSPGHHSESTHFTCGAHPRPQTYYCYFLFLSCFLFFWWVVQPYWRLSGWRRRVTADYYLSPPPTKPNLLNMWNSNAFSDSNYLLEAAFYRLL